MILSVSERTDICAFYSDWFYKRIEEGFVYVRNPFFPEQVSKIDLHPDNIDAIIFCTKNPIPMLDRLDLLDAYDYEFQITITPYLKDIEPYVVAKGTLIKAIKTLSKRIGNDRISIRYDPILLNERYTMEVHFEMFEKLCRYLEGYTHRIIISFVDMKKNTLHNMKDLKLIPIDDKKAHILAKRLGEVAHRYHMDILTCAEKYDFSEYGFKQEGCTSDERMYHLTGKLKKYPKNTKRALCNCLQTVDISAYNTCLHFCKYCYANYDEGKVRENYRHHDPDSPMLIGDLQTGDKVKERKK